MVVSKLSQSPRNPEKEAQVKRNCTNCVIVLQTYLFLKKSNKKLNLVRPGAAADPNGQRSGAHQPRFDPADSGPGGPKRGHQIG